MLENSNLGMIILKIFITLISILLVMSGIMILMFVGGALILFIMKTFIENFIDGHIKKSQKYSRIPGQ